MFRFKFGLQMHNLHTKHMTDIKKNRDWSHYPFLL